MKKIEVEKIAEMKGHSAPVYALENAGVSGKIYSGSSDKIVALWNLETFEAEKFAARFPAIIYSICHVPEKKLLLAGTAEGKIHMLDLEKKEETKILALHSAPVFDIRVSEGKIYSVSGDGTFAVCSLETLSAEKVKKLCNEKIRSLDFSGNQVAFACGDSYLRIFDKNTLAEIHSFKAHEKSANVVKFNSSGFLLTGGWDAHLKIWDKNYHLLESIPAHNYAIYSIAFSPDSNYFATASRDKTIKIWGAEKFELLVRISKENLSGHGYSVNKVFWASYNDYLISTGDDKLIMVWKIIS